jgi:hypothetical protein
MHPSKFLSYTVKLLFNFSSLLTTKSLYLLHFLELYPSSNVPLLEERADTAWATFFCPLPTLSHTPSPLSIGFEEIMAEVERRILN